MSASGINMRGHTASANYRTTREIRAWAVSALDRFSVDDLDECRVALKLALPQSVWRRGSILALNSSGPARPYMARLRVFRRLI